MTTETEEFEFRKRLEDEQAAAQAKPAAPEMVQPNDLQRRMGIRNPRVKDERFIQNVGHAIESAPYEAGGAVTDATGSPVLGSLTAGGVEAVPYVMGGFGAGRAAVGALKSGGERLMQIALKPGKAARDSGDATKAVRTLLEEGANVTEGGVAKLTEKIDALDDELGAVIKSSKGKLLNTDILQNLRGILAQYGEGTLASKNIAKINEVADELLKHKAFAGGNEMSVQAAQAMKRQNYKELGDKAFGMGLRPEAERDALKSITNGLKEGIERAAPEAGPLNAQMSPLINARDLAQQRAMVAGNNNLGGIGLLNPKTLLLSLADRSPLMASLAARGLYSGAAPAAPLIGAAAGGAAGGLLNSINEPPSEGILSRRTKWIGSEQGANK